MFNLTKKSLSRRTVLRGAGAAVALPFLDAMVPAGTALANTPAAPRVKFGFVYFPHGAVEDRWTPTGTGHDYDLPQILAPLDAYKDRMTVITGTRNQPANKPPTHAVVPGTWLSAVEPRISHEPYGGVTIDQMLARQLGQDTQFPSLEFATEQGGNAGACDRAYGCSYGMTVSFRTPSQPLPMEYNPRTMFYRLFGEGDSAEERALIVEQYSSVLDQVAHSATSLKQTLGATDRVRLEAYLDSVREIERRVQRMGDQDFSAMQLPEAPVGVPTNYDEHLDLMYDLMALAYQANLTRVIAMMTQSEVSNMTFPQVGVSDAFHPLSHHQNNPQKLDRLASIQTYNTEHFARYVAKLAEMEDGENSLLDNMILLYGSNMANSDAHNHDPLPTAILGGGAGALGRGKHIAAERGTPHANTLLTIVQKAGLEAESIGDSNGVFDV